MLIFIPSNDIHNTITEFHDPHSLILLTSIEFCTHAARATKVSYDIKPEIFFATVPDKEQVISFLSSYSQVPRHRKVKSCTPAPNLIRDQSLVMKITQYVN